MILETRNMIYAVEDFVISLLINKYLSNFLLLFSLSKSRRFPISHLDIFEASETVYCSRQDILESVYCSLVKDSKFSSFY